MRIAELLGIAPLIVEHAAQLFAGFRRQPELIGVAKQGLADFGHLGRRIFRQADVEGEEVFQFGAGVDVVLKFLRKDIFQGCPREVVVPVLRKQLVGIVERQRPDGMLGQIERFHGERGENLIVLFLEKAFSEHIVGHGIQQARLAAPRRPGNQQIGVDAVQHRLAALGHDGLDRSHQFAHTFLGGFQPHQPVEAVAVAGCRHDRIFGNRFRGGQLLPAKAAEAGLVAVVLPAVRTCFHPQSTFVPKSFT